MENGNRTQSVDIAKGILIILVVVAHAQAVQIPAHLTTHSSKS